MIRSRGEFQLRMGLTPHDLQVDKVRLPKLVGSSRRMPKRFRRRQHDEGWTRNQVIRLEDAIDARFREKVALLVRQPPCQFPRRSLGIRQRGVDNPLPHRQWNPVPVPTGRFLPASRNSLLHRS